MANRKRSTFERLTHGQLNRKERRYLSWFVKSFFRLFPQAELTIHGICTALASVATMAVLRLAKLAR